MSEKSPNQEQTDGNWRQPVVISEGDQELLQDVVDQFGATVVNEKDSLLSQLQEETTTDPHRIEQITEEQLGNFVYYPSSNTARWFLPKNEHRALRTARNRGLIGEEVQAELYDTRIAVYGLSVGSNIVGTMLMHGVGGEFDIADPDIVETSNLNRIVFANTEDVGSKKIDVVSEHIAKMDPYITIRRFPDGVDAASLTQLTKDDKPDLIFEEVDDLRIKYEVRKRAKELGIALATVSDVGETSIIDVERYDLDPDISYFNGRLQQPELNLLESGAALEPQQRLGLMVKLIGQEHITPELMRAVQETGVIPQLGVTAVGGATHATRLTEAIVRGDIAESGRWVWDEGAKNLADNRTQ